MKAMMFGLFLGLALGGAGVWFGGDAVRGALGAGGTEYLVVSERQEEERLVLVLRAGEGQTVLATFRERAADVAELVSVGDTVRIAQPGEGVFADDVAILSVRPAGAAPEPTVGDGGVPEDAEVGDGSVPETGDGGVPDEEAAHEAPHDAHGHS